MADGREPLREAVPRLALAATCRDLRFQPLAEGELPHLSVEITLLGPLVRLPADPATLIEGLDPQICGVYLRSAESTGLLLPQVARRLGWDALELLEQVSLKAGLERDAWRRPGVEIYGFQARCFEAVKPGGLAAGPGHGITTRQEPEAAP